MPALISLTAGDDANNESITINGQPTIVNTINIEYNSATEIQLSGAAILVQYQVLLTY